MRNATRFRRARGAAALLAPLIAMAVLAGGSARADASFSQINHMVVVMQENRSFDHYLGHLHDYQQNVLQKNSSVEPEPSTPNLDSAGNPVAPFHQTDYCEVHDLDHSWTGTHREWNHGAMDGFVKQNEVPATNFPPTSQDDVPPHGAIDGSRTMGYYTEADLPYYYDLYDRFAMSDTYFSSVLDQTFPNRFYLLTGTSFGHIRNDFPFPPTYNPATDFSQRTIFDQLNDAGVSWRVYFNEVPFSWLFGSVRASSAGHVFPISQYYVDAAAGQLPAVSFVDPVFIAPVNVENDEHPPANVQQGQLFVANVVNALYTSPNWSDSALFITYDEHGGYYDHLPPPKAVAPDNIPPMLNSSDYVDTFEQLGIRVPFVVVSPFAKANQNVSALPVFVQGPGHQGATPSTPVYANKNHVFSHTSILKTLEERFVPAGPGQFLTPRVEESNDLRAFFTDTADPTLAPPPLSEAVPDPAHAADCEKHEHIPTDL